MDKNPDAFRTISEAAADLDVPQHVLRFWETRFSHIKPMKRGGGRRYYRPEDIELLKAIRSLLYGEGYTIRGVQRLLKEQGVKSVIALAAGGESPLAVMPKAAPVEAQAPPEALAETGGVSGEEEALLRAALADVDECLRILRANGAAPVVS
jgi:DNA-binding transcriptional MerR regulator